MMGPSESTNLWPRVSIPSGAKMCQSLDSSTPTILWPRVRIQSTTSTLQIKRHRNKIDDIWVPITRKTKQTLKQSNSVTFNIKNRDVKTRQLGEQRDQKGAKFYSFWLQILLEKQPKYLENCLGILKSITFKVKTIMSTFLATFGEIGLLFTLPSGHTAHNQ